MTFSYTPWLVPLSIPAAVLVSFTSLSLASRVAESRGMASRAWLVVGAASLGLGIWSMHVIGMLVVSGPLHLWLAIPLALLTLTLVMVKTQLESRARLHVRRLQTVNSRFRHRATHDATTGLPNRATFLRRLQAAIDDSAAAAGAPLLGVMLVDLDRFKIVNDSLGHEVGDAILREATARLLSIVASNDAVARMGGDEFLVMMRTADTKRVIDLAARIVQNLSKAYTVNGVELHLSASVGVTTYPFDNSEPDVLLSHADEAMYEAKHRGGNGFQFFVPGTTVFTKQRLELENDLRNAAALGQLELHYQPQVDIASGRIMGLEALARWNHPVRGWVSPAEFIPLAEASDLILQIGQWILEEACRQAREWHRDGFTDVVIAVNFSARQFRQSELLSVIERTVARHELSPKHIVVELTESVVMSDADRAVDVLEQLHGSGFEVAVDDFGTGYSSMSYLRRLPVGKLKIDRSFVSDLGASAKSDAIVKAVIALAHGLNMTVVAEGVESARQLAFLRAFDCDQYQGHLFSRARNAADIAQMLARPPQPVELGIDEVLLIGSG